MKLWISRKSESLRLTNPIRSLTSSVQRCFGSLGGYPRIHRSVGSRSFVTNGHDGATQLVIQGAKATVDGLFIYVVCRDAEYASYDEQMGDVVAATNKRYRKELVDEQAKRAAEYAALEARKRRIFGAKGPG